MKYKFLFDDGSVSVVDVKKTKDRHLHMRDEIERITRLFKEALKDKVVVAYERF